MKRVLFSLLTLAAISVAQTIVNVHQGGTGANNTATSTRYLKGNGTAFVTSSGAASGVGTCTNQFVRVLNGDAAPTCATVAGTDFANQSANRIFAGPDSGGAASPTFRLLVANDIPALSYAPITHALLSATHSDTTATAPTRGDIITAQTATAKWTPLAKGTQYQTLQGGATEPLWNALHLDQATAITGLLPVGSGGTGVNTLASNGVLYGNGAGVVQVTVAGGANTVLTANGGVPSFSASPTIGTSVTTPIIYGGTAAGSTLILAGTSNGAPVNANILLNSLGEGKVGIGIVASMVAPLEVGGVPATVGDAKLVMRFWNSSDIYSTPPKSSLGFLAKYNSLGTAANLAQISGGKENALDGDYASYLAFHTRINGGVTTERVRIDSAGNVGIALVPSGTYKLEVNGSLSATSYYVGATAGVDKVCAAAPTAMTVSKGIITAIMCI